MNVSKTSVIWLPLAVLTLITAVRFAMRNMDLIQFVLISIQIASSLTKRYASSSDESIENLLYYKDCQRKAKPKEEPKPVPVPLRALAEPVPTRPFECPFPKMCCSLSCNNECGNGPPAPSIFGRQMDGPMAFNQPPSPPHQPQLPVQPQVLRGRKKRVKPPLLPPIGARREFGFTKERIKSLIAKDEDIRKILKELVRVTMQKVDLVAMINGRKTAAVEESTKSEISNSAEDLEIE